MADLGDTLNFRSDLYDKPVEQGGVLVNATTVTLTITLPDATIATPSITNPPATTGKYLFDYVSSVAGPSGRYVGKWLFTMASGKTTSYVETFDVGSSLITVDEAQARLRSAGIITSAADLEQLQWLCMVATATVETALDRTFMRRSVTATYDGGTDVIRLWKTPVLSVTSVVESGVTLSATPGVDWVLAGPIGFLYRGSASSLSSWAAGTQNIVVTYQAGYADPPREVRELALGTVQELWQASQQASHPLLEESVALPVESAMSLLSGPLRDAYNRLRRKGVA